jgi:hypothetical protein
MKKSNNALQEKRLLNLRCNTCNKRINIYTETIDYHITLGTIHEQGYVTCSDCYEKKHNV